MKFLHQLLKSKFLLAGLMVASLAFAGSNIAHAALPRDCEPNSIINCGFQNQTDFKNAYNANQYGDIPAIYNHFGFQKEDMDRFTKEAKWATAYKDDRLVLDDGRVVMTGSWSIGRTDKGNPHTTAPIGGKTYRWGYNHTAFHSNSIRALVLMDKDNKYVEFAVLTSCGNPIGGTKPRFQCDKLHYSQKDRTNFEFWTDVTAKDGATIKNIAYNFGDGKTANKTNPAERVPHTYTKAGNYKVTVTVTYTVNGKEQKETIQINCQTNVTVKEEEKPKPPVYACKAMAAHLIEGNRKYKFVVTASAADGAKLTKVDFDFGDGQKAEDIKPATTTGTIQVTVEHQYAATLDGKKTITADLTFNIGSDTKNAKCTADVELKKETCADKPTAPECQPPKEECKPGIPKGDDRCKDVLPAEIVKTGPAQIVMGALGLSSIAGAGMYYRASRRNLVDKLLNR